MYVNQTFVVSGFFMNLASIALSIYFIVQVANRGNADEWRKGCLAGLAF
jgi:Bax inhibitor 1